MLLSGYQSHRACEQPFAEDVNKAACGAISPGAEAPSDVTYTWSIAKCCRTWVRRPFLDGVRWTQRVAIVYKKWGWQLQWVSCNQIQSNTDSGTCSSSRCCTPYFWCREIQAYFAVRLRRLRRLQPFQYLRRNGNSVLGKP